MKNLILSTVFLLCSLSLFAQEHHPKFEKIKALKTAHITNALDLSQKEAEKFWPIYNESEAKTLEIRKKMKESHRKAMQNFDKLSDSEAKKIINESIDFEGQLHQEKVVLFKNVMKVLSAKKTMQLQKAEHEFKRKLLRRMKGKGKLTHRKK